MTLGKIGEVVKEQFTVLDMGNSLVDSIPTTEFSAHLYDPDDNEIYNGSNVSFTELSDGHYCASFTPNKVGNWMLVVYHSTYFSWGKSDSIQVFNNDFDSISTVLTRILGLTQENYLVDNTIYDTEGNMTSSRIRIYDDSVSVGSGSNIMATYSVSASYIGNQMDKYSVTKD